MSARHRALWALAVVLSLALLIAPALWNGFALLQWDTGGYLARWYEGYLVPSRAVVYGLILFAGVPFAFWPVLILQSALTIWVLALILRAHGFANRPLLLLGIIVTLSAFTTLPWLTAILLTDIFCGLSVLALYLLLLRSEALGSYERLGLVALIAVAVATHNATLGVLMALTACALPVSLFDRARIARADVVRGIGALALGGVLVLGVDFAVAHRLAWTPGGAALSFGRMLQDGIVKKYLDEHCPDPRLRLCAVKDRIPQDADTWFWGSDLFDQMGRFDGLGDEMQTIAFESLIDYPALQLKSAAIDTLRQLIDVRTGEGVLDDLWHTRTIIERYAPQLVPAMRAAREQKGEISFDAINDVQYPLAIAALALLPLVALLAMSGVASAAAGELASTVMLAVLANAFVCGVLSNPHDRYGARIVWLATVTVLVAALEAAAAYQRSSRPRAVIAGATRLGAPADLS